MNDQPPASKRQRVDTHATDDDNLPPNGGSVLGKRKRKDNNGYLYNSNTQVVDQAATPSHLDNGVESMNTDLKENAVSSETNPPRSMPRVNDFKKGHQLDIKVTDEHQESSWTTCTVCKVHQDKILVHIPRIGAQWKAKSSEDLAPAGAYTDGLS